MTTDYDHLAVPATILTAPHTVTTVTHVAHDTPRSGTVTVTAYDHDTTTDHTTPQYREVHAANEPVRLTTDPHRTAAA